ncbi:MAG: glycosyltransferase family 2 protein [Gammaproteobacteria bacterium]
MPEVSVIIPLYNHSQFIKEAVDSVLQQSFEDFELIIIDDGSKDDSYQVAKSIVDSRIRLYQQQNQGAHNTINRGISLAAGTYIAILNSDDIWMPDRLQKCIDVFNGDASIAAVFSRVECIDADGALIRRQQEEMPNFFGIEKPSDYESLPVSMRLLRGNFLYTTSNLVCRKSVFDELEAFKDLRFVHDYEFFLRLTSRFGTFIIEEPLLKYRYHDRNTINESPTDSVFETGLVLSDYLMSLPVAELQDNGRQFESMERLYRLLNTFGSDRLIIMLLLFGRNKDLFAMMKAEEALPFRQTVLASLSRNPAIDAGFWYKRALLFRKLLVLVLGVASFLLILAVFSVGLLI